MNYLIPFLLVSLFLLVFFFIALNLIIFSVKKNSNCYPHSTNLLHISVLIAVKNESDKIDALLNSLAKLDYPEEKHEFVFVDDNSSDNSYEKLKKFAENRKNVKIIRAEDKPFPAKKGALAKGLEQCLFPNIALTDADCMPQPQWLQAVSAALIKHDVAFGVAPLLPSGSFASRFASYESGKNQLYNFASLKLGIPLSATGRNFAYRKSAYEKTGGYLNTIETLSGDDDLFLREAFKKKLKIGFIPRGNSSVYSYAVKNWKEYFSQRSRHVKTSHKYTAGQKTVAAVIYLSEIILTYAFLLYPINWALIFISVLKIKIAYYNSVKLNCFFGEKFSLPQIILFELFFPLAVIVNFFLSLFFPEKWRE